MDISGVNASSPEAYYDSLTSPFIVKKVTINAHTPYDEVDEKDTSTDDEVFSRASFHQKKHARLRYKIPSSTASVGIKSPGNFIENAISGGISPQDAVQMYKAQAAYGLSMLGNYSGVSLLSTRCYET